MQLLLLALQTACEKLKCPRQGGEVIKDSDHAPLGSLVVQVSEDPREAVSPGQAGFPAHMSWSSALPYIYAALASTSYWALTVPFLGVRTWLKILHRGRSWEEKLRFLVRVLTAVSWPGPTSQVPRD